MIDKILFKTAPTKDHLTHVNHDLNETGDDDNDCGDDDDDDNDTDDDDDDDNDTGDDDDDGRNQLSTVVTG